MPTATEGANRLCDLPREVLVMIVLLLPMDGYLSSLQHSCRMFYALLGCVHLASSHARTHFPCLNQARLKRFSKRAPLLRCVGLPPDAFASLPRAHKAAVLGAMFKGLMSGHFRELLGDSEAADAFAVSHSEAPQILHTLLDAGILQQSRAFVWAARFGHVDAIRLLLHRGVDPSVQDHKAIRYSAEHNHPHVLQILLDDARTNPSAHENDCLITAAKAGHMPILRILLRHPLVDPSARENAALWECAKHGHLEAATLLLAHPRVNPSDRESDALLQAVKYNHVELVKRLLEDPRCDPLAQDKRILYFAQKCGHEAVLHAFLADPRVEKETGLVSLVSGTGEGRDRRPWFVSDPVGTKA